MAQAIASNKIMPPLAMPVNMDPIGQLIKSNSKKGTLKTLQLIT